MVSSLCWHLHSCSSLWYEHIISVDTFRTLADFIPKGLDTTIAADVQGPILEAFGDIEKLSWVGIGFPMGSVSIVLLVGALYALFDVKWMFIGSLVLFEAGSALCGAAPNMNALIVGRVIAGTGGAGMYLG